MGSVDGKQKPTSENTLRCFPTSAYASTGLPESLDSPSSRHPTMPCAEMIIGFNSSIALYASAPASRVEFGNSRHRQSNGRNIVVELEPSVGTMDLRLEIQFEIAFGNILRAC